MGFVRPGVECNLCDWRGPQFASDVWHPHTICPRCGAYVRHRLLAAALAHRADVSPAVLVSGKDVVHFAPEAPVAALLRPLAKTYRTAEFAPAPGFRPDLVLDIANMPKLATASTDLIVACDILEHVPDDQAARREVFRVLRPGGWAIFTVPQKDGLATTFEDPTATTPEDRKRIFGQHDHLRIYGEDFANLVAQAGFRVTAVAADAFSKRLVRRHVLFPPILSSHPLATNNRRIYFGQKPAV